jgi:hypothetical protein
MERFKSAWPAYVERINLPVYRKVNRLIIEGWLPRLASLLYCHISSSIPSYYVIGVEKYNLIFFSSPFASYQACLLKSL